MTWEEVRANNIIRYVGECECSGVYYNEVLDVFIGVVVDHEGALIEVRRFFASDIHRVSSKDPDKSKEMLDCLIEDIRNSQLH